jgi:hypothetical protein
LRPSIVFSILPSLYRLILEAWPGSGQPCLQQISEA